MTAASNATLNHQSQCTICLENLAIRTTVTLCCRHTFHLDCLGLAFNAAKAMRCLACRVVEEGVWRSYPTRAPRSSRAGAHATREDVHEHPVRMQPPSGIYWSVDQGWFSGSLSLGHGGPIRHPYLFQPHRREIAHVMMGSANGSGQASALSDVTRISHLRLGVNRRPNYGYSFQGNVDPNEDYDPFPQGMNNIQLVRPEAPDAAFSGEPIFYHRANAGSLFGRLAGAAPVEQSMNFPSLPVHAMMRAANSRSRSSGLLPAEQTAFPAEESVMVNIQLPGVGEVAAASSADVQLGEGVGGPEDIMSDVEESVEDLS